MSADITLNQAQQRAVEITDGPVLVVAGAGTGKTRVITERITHLVTHHGVAPESILALTFTEKAAGEMLERISEASLDIGLGATIATFNRFGNDLLQTYGNEYGLGALRLLGETGQLVFLREHLDDFNLEYFAPISNPDGQLDTLAKYVSLLKQQLVLPEAYEKFVDTLPTRDAAEQLEKQKHQELASFFATYLALCRQEQVIDYDDQLYVSVGLLRARPNILKSLQQQYRYILVDEFQDTNPMQAALVDLIVGGTAEKKSQPHAGNIMVVGDDDQSIYGWRGATLANILDFKTRYPTAQQVTLTENYRSTQAILDSAYRLIQHNNPHRLEVINQLDKRLHAAHGKGMAPRLEHFTNFDSELTWVAEDIQRRIDAGEAPGSIAVLARRNQGVERVHEALELHSIPHAVVGLSNDMYQQLSVSQLIEALKTIADPLDNLSLFHTLSSPLFRIETSRLAKASGVAKRQHESLIESIKAEDWPEAHAALDAISAWQAHASQQSVGTLAYTIITESGWKQQLYEKAEHDADTFTEVQALSQFFKTLKEFEKTASVPSVQNYITNLPVLQAAGSGFEDASLQISDSLVNVLSIHRAKGLEWQTVYIVDCTEGSFPLRAAGGGLKLPDELRASQAAADEHIAEERRLMYVAATRAKSNLIISYADRHGSGAPRKPSRFLTELLGHEPDASAQDDGEQSSLELFSPRTTNQTVDVPSNMLQNGHLTLSVSQVETWLRCPQDFYYKYVLAMPLPPAPQLSYGTLIHGMIERIHNARKLNQPIPSVEAYTKEILDALPKAGYVSKQSRERVRAQASKTVKAVYDRFTHDELPLETEQAILLQLPDLSLTIRGRIDAVYRTEQGVEICDFKTGTSVNTPEKAKSRATGSNQLTLYALAWQTIHGEMPQLLSLDFVETGQRGSVRKQQKSLETLQRKLADMGTCLRKNEYPTARDHAYCMHPN